MEREGSGEGEVQYARPDRSTIRPPAGAMPDQPASPRPRPTPHPAAQAIALAGARPARVGEPAAWTALGAGLDEGALRWARGPLVFLAYAIATIIMTWPWAKQL